MSAKEIFDGFTDTELVIFRDFLTKLIEKRGATDDSIKLYALKLRYWHSDDALVGIFTSKEKCEQEADILAIRLEKESLHAFLFMEEYVINTLYNFSEEALDCTLLREV